MGRIFAYLQYLLPRYWMTALIYRLARARSISLKNFLITRFVRLYSVDTGDVELDIPDGFATFNEFFIRELRPGARPVDDDEQMLVSPVDGTVSQAGAIRDDLILQAKGRDYTLGDLLATDLEDADAYRDGVFATLYLAPYNYHRVHAPLDGELVALRYIPGELFSVNAATAAAIPGLFRRNERLVMHFRTAAGPAVLIMVGALNVGSITTPWSGEIRPRKRGTVEIVDINGPPNVARGDLLGWFNMGSTIIMLLPRGSYEWHGTLQPGESVVMGRPIGTLTAGRS